MVTDNPATKEKNETSRESSKYLKLLLPSAFLRFQFNLLALKRTAYSELILSATEYFTLHQHRQIQKQHSDLELGHKL